MNNQLALLLLMTWCFSGRASASVASVLTMHPSIPKCLWVNHRATVHFLDKALKCLCHFSVENHVIYRYIWYNSKTVQFTILLNIDRHFISIPDSHDSHMQWIKTASHYLTLFWQYQLDQTDIYLSDALVWHILTYFAVIGLGTGSSPVLNQCLNQYFTFGQLIT